MWMRQLPEPRPAWPASQPWLRFDLSYSPVAADTMLFVPSMVTDTVTAYDTETGNEKWSKDGLGVGSLILVDGKLIVLSDRGTLLVAEASPKGFAPVAQARVLSGQCWTAPVLSGGRIFCRNSAGDLVCLDVKAEK